MKTIGLAGLLFLVLPCLADAATVCAIPNGDQTAIVRGPVDCSQSFSTPAISLDTSDTRWTTYQAGVVAQALGLRYQRLYKGQIALGIALTSTGTSSLNGTYPVAGTLTGSPPGQSDWVANLAGLARSVGTNFVPGGGSSVALYDMSGNPHTFNSTNIINFADAVGQLLLSYSFQNWVSGGNTFPANTKTIP